MRELLAEYGDVHHPRNVGLISLSHGINEFYSIVIPPIIPLLVTDLGITYAQAGFLLTIFFVMYSLFQLPAGLLADRVGKKRVLVWGLVGMAGSLVVASTADSYATLLVAQAMAGISGSTYHPTGMSLVSDLQTEATEGKAMGVFGFGGMVGVALAPLTVGGVASVLDWRTALVAAAGFGFAFVVAFQLLFEESATGSSSVDGDDPAPEPDGGTGGVVGAVSDWVARALRFRVTPGVVVLTAITLLISLQLRALHTFATGFVVDGVGRAASTANGLFVVMLAASAVASVWGGSLADRVDRRRLGAAAAALTSVVLAVMFGLTAVDASAGSPLATAGLAGSFAVLGLAVYGCSPVKNALISEYATEDSSGSLFGVMQTASAVGSATGPAVFGVAATEVGVEVAFPAIAGVSVLIAAGFLLLSGLDGADG